MLKNFNNLIPTRFGNLIGNIRPSQSKSSRTRRRNRRGLAPVEMALSLPLLMGFVAALVALFPLFVLFNVFMLRAFV